MKKLVSIVLSFAFIFMLSACGGKSSGAASSAAPAGSTAEKKYKDTLTVATYEDPTTLDPMGSNRAGIILVNLHIFDPLVYEATDGSGTISPMLAKSWEYLDDTTLRFHLRDDVTFHDGSKFTAEDVLYSFTRAKANPVSASTFAPFDLDNTVIVDDYTIDVKFYKPYAPVFNTLSSGRAYIVPKAAVEKMGDAEFARKPVGTGPYKFVDWKTGSEIALTRNDEYWGDKARTKNLVFKVVTEASSRVIALETGEADIANSISGTDARRVDEIDGVSANIGQSNRYTLLTFSMQDETLGNKDLRYALSLAIDRDSLVNACYGATAAAATGYMPSNVAGYKEMGAIPYDVAQAKEYLQKSGLSNVTIDLLNDGTDEFRKVAEAIQNMWSAIGVNTNIVTNSSISTYLSQGGHIQAALRAGNANEASNVFIIYDSAFGNHLQPNNDWLDAQLAEAKTILDGDKRNAFYGEIQDWLYDERYSVPLAYTAAIYGISDKVEGFQFHPSYMTNLSTVRIAE